MSYSRKEIYAFTRRLHYLLRHHQNRIIFQRIRGAYGYYDYETDEITIDHRKDIISTLIHEALHKWHNDWPEGKVIAHERQIMNSLTPRMIKKIIRVIANNL